jgi:nicotinate-nucleotide adenylyltransferase
MNIGLYFGSFNPLHTGHLIIAEQLLTQAGLDKIWFVLSPQNPFKQNEEMVDEGKRLLILKKAIDGNNHFEVCDAEFYLPKPSYTIDTLHHLSNQFPEHTFSILLGSDNLGQFTQWKSYEEILHGYRILVYARGTIDEKWEQYRNILLFDVPYIHISATYIRQLVKQGKSIKYLVPESIEEDIKSFYK